MKAEPQKEHQWLQKLLGEWTYDWSEPGKAEDQPSQKLTGTERFKSLGEIWILGEGKGEMPGGGAANTLITLGYDPAKRRFVGTWVGSMMTHMWVYDGGLNADGTVLTLDTEGPHMSVEGKTAKYRDVIEMRSDDHRVLTASVLGDDEKWQELMTTNYYRRKS